MVRYTGGKVVTAYCWAPPHGLESSHPNREATMFSLRALPRSLAGLAMLVLAMAAPVADDIAPCRTLDPVLARTESWGSPSPAAQVVAQAGEWRGHADRPRQGPDEYG